MSSNHVMRLESIFKDPQDLENRYRAELEKAEGPQKWEIAKEAARLTQVQTELAAFVAHVQKSVIEG